jgi:hypothetical protein
MPVSTTALAALSVGNTLGGFFGAQGAARGAKAQGNYQGAIYDQNASLADQQAKDALAIGEDQVSQHRAEVRQLIGSERAALGAQGIAIDSGSALDVQTNSAAMGELDTQRIVNNAKRRAWGFSAEAAGYRSQAVLARMAGDNAAQTYRNAGFSTLLTGASNIANLYYTPGVGRSVPSASRIPNGRLITSGPVMG